MHNVARSIVVDWMADAITAVVELRLLGSAVDEIFLSATPNIGVSAPESWGDEMDTLQLEVLLPLIEKKFDSGTLGWHIENGRIRSRPLSGLEADGACVALAAITGTDLKDLLMGDDYFDGDSFTGIWLSFTAEEATDIVFAGRDG